MLTVRAKFKVYQYTTNTCHALTTSGRFSHADDDAKEKIINGVVVAVAVARLRSSWMTVRCVRFCKYDGRLFNSHSKM